MRLRLILNYICDTLFPPSHVARALRADTLPSVRNAPKSTHDFIVSLFDYKDPFVEQMIWELKFYRNKNVARLCAPHIYAHIYEESVVVPVPISKKKRREKGFNQTELICEALIQVDKRYCLTYAPNIIEKIRHTKNQHDIHNKQQRLENLKNVFSVTNTTDLNNQNIVLIDDVYTTGATLMELKKVLEEAGAKSVRAITIAH